MDRKGIGVFPGKVWWTLLLLLLISNSPAAPVLDSTAIEAGYYKSYNYEKSSNYPDAIKSLQLIYQAYPKVYGINNRLGYLYRLNRQFKNSEYHYKQAIQALPDALSPRLGLMLTYLQMEAFDEANRLGFQIINIDFYNYYGNLRLAYGLRLIGNNEMAEKILLKMLARYPSDALYLTELGLLTLSNGEVERAYAIMKDVQILDPENVTAKSVLLSLSQ